MYAYRLLPLALLCCLLLSCTGKQTLFYVPSSIDAASLEGIAQAIKDYEEAEELPVFSKATLYKCSFAQAFVESEHVLEKVQLHDSGKTKGVEFLESFGPRQELYFLELPSSERTYFVYFSIWSNDADRTRHIRFGPAYLGKLNPALGTIVFFKNLKPKVQERHMDFSAKKGGGFFFVMNTDAFQKDPKRIVIDNIVLTESNKIGGGKKYVYNVAGSKLERFVFSFAETIKLN
jgi:hypothetical protein